MAKEEYSPDLSVSAQLVATVLYVTYAASGVAALIPPTMLVASFVLFGALIVARVLRPRANAILATHYRWLIRTFWIGTGLYLPVVSIGMLALAAPEIDTTALMDAMVDGTATTPEQMNDLLMAQQPESVKNAMFIIGAVFGAWWLWRCGYGFWKLWSEAAIPQPERWW